MVPAFTPKSLADLEPLIYNIGVSRMVALLERHADAGDTIDMMDMFQRFAFVSYHIISHCVIFV
jgi:cytochrome P450